MRIWLLSSELPQEFAGGIARYIENYARLLGAAGHDVTVIARTAKPAAATIAPGVQLLGVVPRNEVANIASPADEPDTHPAYPFNIMAYWPALSYQFAEEVLALLERLPAPDVIECQEYGALPYYLLLRKLSEHTALNAIPIVVHMHTATFDLMRINQEPRFRFPNYWVGQMEKFCILAADALLSPSHFLACSVEQTLARPLNIAVIRYPVLAETDAEISPGTPQRIVYVGRLEVRKGVLAMVKACSRLWEGGADFTLALVGGDTDFMPRGTTVEAFLRQRYSRWIGTGQLEFVGQRDHAGVLEAMRDAWAVAVPSLWENFPNTCIEAMSLGQVPLVSRAGGQAEMVEHDGVNGFIFDWETPGDFERQLGRVLALGPAERQQIAANAQRRIHEICGPGLVIPQRIHHYETTLARHAPRRAFPVVSPPPPAELLLDAPRGAAADEQPGLLSVVTTFYNLGAYIEETLESVLASTYTPREVVIVDDGSTDPASLEALDRIRQRALPDVRIVRTTNQGLAAARNNGADAARGEFIAFVDADDAVEPAFFSRAVDTLQRYDNVAFVYSWVRYFGESNAVWPTWSAELPYMLGHNMLTPIAVVRRAWYQRAGRNRPAFEYNFEDYESWLSIVLAGGMGVSLPQPLVRYRVRPGSLWRQGGQNQFLFLYDLLAQHHPAAYARWSDELFHLQNANGPGLQWEHPGTQPSSLHHEYVVQLEELRDKLWTDNQFLGKAWNDHVAYIEGQRQHITQLEGILGSGDDWLSGVELRAIRASGRLVQRVRRTWVVQQVLRRPGVKHALKKMLKI